MKPEDLRKEYEATGGSSFHEITAPRKFPNKYVDWLEEKLCAGASGPPSVNTHPFRRRMVTIDMSDLVGSYPLNEIGQVREKMEAKLSGASAEQERLDRAMIEKFLRSCRHREDISTILLDFLKELDK